MGVENIYIGELVKRINAECLTEYEGLQERILDDSISRPSLELSGVFDFFKPTRIQVFGLEEQELVQRFLESKELTNIERILDHTEIPLIIFSRGKVPNQLFIDACDARKIPVYTAPVSTTMLIAKLSQVLREFFAPQTSIHGVMLDVCGIGVLIQGKSSIGKSETALELITRGKSQLVSDDRVILYENEPGMLIARAPRILERMIEIRGIGIVDVISMYGGGTFKPTKRLSLVIQLQNWDKDFQYNRIGADIEYIRFMDTQVAQVVLPIHPGRNVASLIEAAALNFKLRQIGINTAEEFTSRLTSAIADNTPEERG
ncbi:HPr kinase/phosphorylase [Erysipelotrichaceae bacterium]|nr:HPr kinase/phosphorylase [Erysipelotrichaceae bacterium]